MSTKQQAFRRIAGQFHRPHGLDGRLAGWVMAHRSSNRRRNRWALLCYLRGPAGIIVALAEQIG